MSHMNHFDRHPCNLTLTETQTQQQAEGKTECSSKLKGIHIRSSRNNLQNYFHVAVATNGDEKADIRSNNKMKRLTSDLTTRMWNFFWVTLITQQWQQFSAPYRSRDDLSLAHLTTTVVALRIDLILTRNENELRTPVISIAFLCYYCLTWLVQLCLIVSAQSLVIDRLY